MKHKLILITILGILSNALADKISLDKIKEHSLFKYNGIDVKFAEDFKLNDKTKITLTRTNKGAFTFLFAKDNNGLEQTFVISGEMAVSKIENGEVEPLYIKQDLSYLKDKALVSLGYGKKELILVSNFNCPTCRNLHREFSMNSKYYQNYTFHIIPTTFKHPLKDPTSDNMQMIKSVMVQNDPKAKETLFERYMLLRKAPDKIDYKDYSEKELLDKIIKYIQITDDLGAKATPALFELDGKPIRIDNILIRN